MLLFLCIQNMESFGHVDAFNDPLIDNKDSKRDTELMFGRDHIAK